MSSKKNRPDSRPQSEPKATPADADIVLRLYEQRREPELRTSTGAAVGEGASPGHRH